MFYFIYLYIFTHTGIKQISISDDVRDINGSTSWAGTRYPYRTTEFYSFLFIRLLFSAILYDKIVFFFFSCAFSI
jgi:hypothetical protein